MRNVTFEALTPADRALLQAAREVRKNAYVPYSGFSVGAAVRTKGGQIFTGTNMENASYGVTICAEVGALTAALANGDFQVDAIAVTGGFAEPAEQTKKGSEDPVTPCGRCRQLIYEAGGVSGRDVRVLNANTDLSRITESTIGAMLPAAFGPKDLGRGDPQPLAKPAKT